MQSTYTRFKSLGMERKDLFSFLLLNISTQNIATNEAGTDRFCYDKLSTAFSIFFFFLFFSPTFSDFSLSLSHPLHPIIHVRFKDNLNHLLRLKVHSCKSLVFICKRNVQPYRIYFIEILTFALAYVSIN